MHGRKIKTSFQIYKDALKFEMILVILFILFLVSIEFRTSSHLEKYDGIPCQNKIFFLQKPMRKVIGGNSTMNEGYYYITKNILQDVDEDYVTAQKTDIVFSKGSEFRVEGYYVAYNSGPLSGLGGGPVPEYLVKNIKSNEKFWISYFSFDCNSCNVTTNFDGEHFDVFEHLPNNKITKMEINI
ncbi:hypothetical protein PGH07_08220 [Sulfurovum sp. zt1-1]|uniref:Uncharacterized protein n=1 Tax=Sulfurovum zhangzhouensis TaxID=3019067 RepID=A0ABT7QZ87_9BACT|nr:hypothetical protein [Sulfurovum zhangzhouensis]MDM5272163.1 hypothetical protein [Sulfurovum zhangzhouensis]